MKVRHTFEFSPLERQAIAHRFGKNEAAYKDLISWVIATTESELENLIYEFERAEDQETLAGGEA